MPPYRARAPPAARTLGQSAGDADQGSEEVSARLIAYLFALAAGANAAKGFYGAAVWAAMFCVVFTGVMIVEAIEGARK